MSQIRLCPPALLLDVTIAIERHLEADNYRRWISYESVGELVNLCWVGTSVRFVTDDIKKAIRELQAIDALILNGRDSGGILVCGQPKRPDPGEVYAPRFYGSMGSYDNPTPFSMLRKVFTALPLPHRIFNPATVAEELNYSPAVVVKALRELRLMNSYNYRWSTPGYVEVMRKHPDISSLTYEHVFGNDSQATSLEG